MSASVARNAVNSMNSPIPRKAASYQSRRISRTPIAIPATSSIVPAPAKIEPTSLHVLSVAVRCTSTHRSTLPCRHRPRSMETHAPRRPRSTTSTLMPRVEGRRGPAPAVEALDRVEQPVVIVRAEMFTPQPQPKVPREPSSAVARAGWITGLPEILLFVQDCDRQLRIVRPGSAVHVVGPDQG